MLTSDAKTYIARIVGGAGTQEILDMASEALSRGYADWEAKKLWRFLLKDTSKATIVTACTATSGSPTVNAPSTGAFDFVNIGQTVTVSGNATLAANTTVSSITYNNDGTVASITLSANFGGSTDPAEVLTFSANIPINSGQRDYNLPTDILAPFDAVTTVNKWILTWRDVRYWDRMNSDQTLTGTPKEYTTFNPYSELTQNYGAKRLRYDVIPNAADSLILKYYRRFNQTGTSVDIPDEYLYPFLDYCANILLQRKVAADKPEMVKGLADEAKQMMSQKDDTPTDDDDADQCLKSAMESGMNRNLWNNGAFDPFRW